MPIYLDEDFVGTHASEIIFPHLVLCMGVVSQLNNGTLVGCHISGADLEENVLTEMSSQIVAAAGNPCHLYMIADFEKHFLDRKLGFTAKGRKLNYTGNIHVLDTSGVQTGDGTFARVVSSGGPALSSIYVCPDQNARPYNLVMGPQYTGPAITHVRIDRTHPARFVKTRDSAPRNAQPVAPRDMKIARIN